MHKWVIAGLSFGTVLFASLIIIAMTVLGTLNSEARVRVLIEAKQRDNTSEFDNMKKKISNVAEIPEAQFAILQEIFESHAKARTTDGGGLMKWVQESIPTPDTSIFNNVLNIITSSRDAWTMRQKEIIDMQATHDYMFESQPRAFILSIFNRQKMDRVVIITSTASEEAFKTGKDDDTNVFKKD